MDLRVTDIKIKRAEPGEPRVAAYVTLTLNDSLAMRDMKVIRADDGLFLAMPSRRICRAVRCRCSAKNELRSRFCFACGQPLPAVESDPNNDSGHYADLVFPCTSQARLFFVEAVRQACRDVGITEGWRE